MKKIFLIIFILIIVIFLIVKYGIQSNNITKQKKSVTISKEVHKRMKITSSVFTQQQKIPSQYTCDGMGINPPLEFLEVPENTKSLVLIVDDPDAPGGTFVHWVIYNIDPSEIAVLENLVPKGGIEGINSSGQTGYIAPCPPSGEHHYMFKLYALDAVLTIENSEKVDKKMVESKMQGHILDQAELIGLYSRTP